MVNKFESFFSQRTRKGIVVFCGFRTAFREDAVGLEVPL